MKYPDDFINKVIYGDCLEVMKQIPDKAVDCVITDPPYSSNTHKNAKSNKGKGYGNKTIDFECVDMDGLRSIYKECARVCRGWVISFIDYKFSVKLEENPPKGLVVKRIGIWVKTNPMPQISADRPAQGWESIVFMYPEGKKSVWNGGGKAGIWIHPVVQNGHPTQKPAEIIGNFIELFTKDGDLILDPFLGSGTTAAACKLLNRRFIGIEIEEKYFKIAESRLAQQTLGI